MADDKLGRWARIAYAGTFNNFGFIGKRVCYWEIAWIKKLKIESEQKFSVHYLFPSNGNKLFDNLSDAKKEVVKSFKWFIKCVNTNNQ
jgi:hypothetical protein